MLCITNHITDPYFNIASEEHLLKNFSDDIFMLYINEPSIIVGKHQNTFAEINHRFTLENNIKIVRRLSGGGTVFHDSGNLNFCFIRNGQEGNLIDFKRFTQPIIEVLQSMGVPAERSGRNDLIINGLKFSGNAEHVYKNRTLHHGTLLFSSRLDNLGTALKVNPDLYQDKAVKSVRSKVTNISEYLPSDITIDAFKETILKHLTSGSEEVFAYEFNQHDMTEIRTLIETKYNTWDWNFGYSPRFVFTNRQSFNGKLLEVELMVEKGLIKQAKLTVDKQPIDEVSRVLTGVCYRETDVVKKLQTMNGLETDFVRSILF
ncbi:MAG TPA: lipoate--protein ligase [Bacteroidales bacterium]